MVAVQELEAGEVMLACQMQTIRWVVLGEEEEVVD